MHRQKQHNKYAGFSAIAAVLIAALVIGGIAFVVTQQSDISTNDSTSEDAMMQGDAGAAGGTMLEGSAMPDNGMVGGDAMVGGEGEGDMMEEDAMMKKDEDSMMIESESDTRMEADVSAGAMVQLAGSYETYAQEKLARAADGDVVLFFHAPWCPTCRGLDASLQSAEIPDGLTILKLDYDNETALKQKYGVRSQHTLVQVDAEGNMITSWLGGNTVADIQARVQ